MTAKEIKDIIKKGEKISLECKLASSNVPDGVWETYSAFANTYGGTILLGVQENLKEKDINNRFSIVGVQNADKLKKDIWNIVLGKIIYLILYVLFYQYDYSC